MITNKEIGKTVRLARVEASMNQSELGSLLNITHAAISDIENGKTQIKVVDLIKISEILEKPFGFFIGYDDKCFGLLINDAIQKAMSKCPNCFVVVDKEQPDEK